jgi:hypothetical protein
MKIIASTLIALSLSLASRLRQSPLTEPPPGARRAVRPNKSIVGLRCCTIASVRLQARPRRARLGLEPTNRRRGLVANRTVNAGVPRSHSKRFG